METTAEIESFIQEEFEHIEGSQSGSFDGFWGSIRYTFQDRSYQWRKELCLHMIERMLREDRCRLGWASGKLGVLPHRKERGGWTWDQPIPSIMDVLREWWNRCEGAPIAIHTPDGFDSTTYFLAVIPAIVWPPYDIDSNI